jgi:hypothetical protein
MLGRPVVDELALLQPTAVYMRLVGARRLGLIRNHCPPFVEIDGCAVPRKTVW